MPFNAPINKARAAVAERLRSRPSSGPLRPAACNGRARLASPVCKVRFDADVLDDYRRDSKGHPDTYYTLVPTGRWVLPDTIRDGASFSADLYRGHFERGGTPIRQGVVVKVRRIVHFRRFDAGRQSDPLQWIGFGRGREHFLAHRIEAAPDMDQVVQVSATMPDGAGVRLARAGELKPGDVVPSGAVERVIYTEYGDLAH
jgi:hypothetical protein